MKTEERIQVPLWTKFSASAWYEFEEDFANYKSVGGSLSLDRCVSVSCKRACAINFGFDRWKRDARKMKTRSTDKESKAKPSEAQKDKDDEEDEEDDDDDAPRSSTEDSTHDDEVIDLLRKKFAPQHSFLAQERFEMLRMQAPTMEALMAFNVAFATVEAQCASVLPPAKTLAKIYTRALQPQRLRERLASQDLPKWSSVRQEAMKLMSDLNIFTLFMSPRHSEQQIQSNRQFREDGRETKDKAKKVICFNCNEEGHISRNCVKPKKNDAVSLAMKAVPRTIPNDDEEDEVVVSWPLDQEYLKAAKCFESSVSEECMATKFETAKSFSSKGRFCYTCGQRGHIAKACHKILHDDEDEE
jgi:hypothetical protein